MDTTYFGRKFGVMVFKDSITNQILWKQYVKQETNKLYLEGIKEIVRRGIKIQSQTTKPCVINRIVQRCRS